MGDDELDRLLMKALRKVAPNCRVSASQDGTADYLIERGDGKKLTVELKRSSIARTLDLEALACRHAVLHRDQPRALAVVLPQLSRAMAEHLAAFGEAHLPGTSLFLLSRRGGTLLRIPPWGINEIHPDRAARRGRQAASGLSRSFTYSDSYQWQLKILLLADCPEHWWQGPRGPLATATELADAAGVALSTTSRFLKAIEDLGWLSFDEQQQRLQLRNPEAVMTAWLDHAKLDPPRAIPVRSAMETGDLTEPEGLLAWCQRQKATDTPVAITGWPGLSLEEAKHFAGETVPMLLCENPEEIMRAWRLSQTQTNPDLTLLASSTPRRSFGGSIMNGTARITDAWECLLNLAGHHRLQAGAQAEWMIPEIARMAGEGAKP